MIRVVVITSHRRLRIGVDGGNGTFARDACDADEFSRGEKSLKKSLAEIIQKIFREFDRLFGSVHDNEVVFFAVATRRLFAKLIRKKTENKRADERRVLIFGSAKGPLNALGVACRFPDGDEIVGRARDGAIRSGGQ